MVFEDAIRNGRTGLARGFRLAHVVVVALALGLAGAAQAGSIVDPTDCFGRTNGPADPNADRMNDLVNSPGDGPETGNAVFRSDVFELQPGLEGCFSADVFDISVVVKNPFDIPGPDFLNDPNFGVLSAQMETDFPLFGHWSGNAHSATGLDPTDPNDLNPEGFHGVSVCIFLGDDVGAAGNLDDCFQGIADRLILSDVDGQGMVFSGSLGGDSFFLCGECTDGEFELVTVMYSDTYGNTTGFFAHPQLMVGWQFAAVPEPSVLALLAPVLAAGLLRRRRSG